MDLREKLRPAPSSGPRRPLVMPNRSPAPPASPAPRAAMAWQWLRLYLCLQVPGFCTSLLLSQTPGHILAQTNNRTEITCHMKKDQSGVYWYRWNQERQLFQFLVFSNPLGKNTYGTNISGEKFGVYRGSSRNSYNLHIHRLQASDNGTYYCTISQSSELIFGNGTRLSVVDVLPLPSKSTRAPPSKKPTRCITKSKPVDKKGCCSPFVWIPLAACALTLLLCLAAAIYRFHRLRRRLWLRVHRQ
ncbi:T-cell surface glycoprotein CD8 beta chain [Apteryx rowi]|uniref:T-cell surface glycoprotein CD8 beta chain n=1 Tax=Apteryx rowi TaxID=308060 RepID=UPI000E1DE15A|nr:T-cell surface glycoprotein CD8 beta chain [Apteryx rowi]XP_025920417.1 T-cell surface glycoprotein CD8 beta chain [Apteryx rowi]XP_025920418.1 T-cell surface glycoprotein CD8 beta chain [Apteryx rowi]XP_025920419.1 T-cell surface glycoprotein CD8 beta chain [Apteryx rowi]